MRILTWFHKKTSSQIAKDRLKILLISDRVNCSPEMMDLIKTLAINPENPSAARYLVVDAVNTPKVLDYYLNNGFDFLFSSDEEEMNCLRKTSCPTRLMYFDLIVHY